MAKASRAGRSQAHEIGDTERYGERFELGGVGTIACDRNA
jgi:hypothetical protein